MSDQIELRNMVFYGRHGVLAEERTLGQRFAVDVWLTVDLQQACHSDALCDTVNYAAVYETVQRIVEQQSYALVEKLAQTIADEILGQFQVKVVQVRVKKITPPFAGMFDYMGVTITREAQHG